MRAFMRSGFVSGLLLLGALLLAIGLLWAAVQALSTSVDSGQKVQALSNLIAATGLLVLLLSIRGQADDQRAHREMEMLARFLDEIRGDVRALRLNVAFREGDGSPSESRMLSGSEAIEAYARGFETETDHTQLLHNRFFQDLYFLVGSFDTFRTLVSNTRLPVFERRHLMSRFSFLYTSEVLVGMERISAVSMRGELRLTVQTASQPDIAGLLTAMLSAHERMLAFIQDHRI